MRIFNSLITISDKIAHWGKLSVVFAGLFFSLRMFKGVIIDIFVGECVVLSFDVIELFLSMSANSFIQGDFVRGGFEGT